MRRLGLSLVLAVLAATIGAGWALDRLFDRLVEPAGAGEPLADWRLLGRALADTVAGADDPEAVVAGLASGTAVSAALVSAERLGLDRAPLAVRLQAPLGLALESADGITVYYALDAAGRRLLALEGPGQRPDASLLRLGLTTVFYIALLLMLLLWLLPLTRRLARLHDAALAFGHGDLGARVAIGRHDDVADLETAFNAMAARIGALIDDNRLLGRGVAHDLKTPLARLRFGIDSLEELDAGALPDDRADAPRRTALVTRLQHDLDAMENSLQALLDYARFDVRSAGEPHRSIDPARLLRERLAVRDPSRSGRIELIVPDAPDAPDASATLIGSERELVTLVDNLLDNALRYGRERVRVTLCRGATGTIDLTVEDDGPGVPVADRERVLRPFERGEHRVDDGCHPGHGLGLALVARIAGRHHGRCSIATSSELGGASVRVTLPLAGKRAR